MMNVLVFDIETIPDTVSGAKLYELEGLPPEDIAKAMVAKRIEKTGGSDFLPLHLHRVVAISAVLSTHNSLKVWSLGSVDSDEAELVQRFFDGIDRYTPTLVSWNGGGFDLPVLHYRSLLHKIDARRYWESGEEDREYRYNNYLNRYHWRHIDLMDVLGAFNMRASAPLTEVAVMLGFPGKLGMSGASVWDYFQQGKLPEIRQYCETDVLNTYLIYLRWELVRGGLNKSSYLQEIERISSVLSESRQPHLQSFLQTWQQIS